MRHILTLSSLLILSINLWAQDTWVRVLGGTKNESISSCIATSDGKILITGYTDSNDGDFKNMNKGNTDIFVMKIDEDGNVLWKTTLGGRNSEMGESITETSDGGLLVTGVTSYDEETGIGDIIVFRLDRTGSILWKKVVGGASYEWVESITTTPDGSIWITGNTESNDGDFEGMNKGGEDAFVIKLDQDGNTLWRKTLGGSGGDDAWCIIPTQDNGVLITGSSASNDGDFEGMNKGEDDLFIIRLDKDSNIQWVKTFGGSMNESGKSIITTSDGRILITGLTGSNDGDFEGMNMGVLDIFVIKLEQGGEALWKKVIGGTDKDVASSITTSDDGVLISGWTSSKDGHFKGINRGKEDLFVIKLDRYGSVMWNSTYGGRDSESVSSINRTSDGSIVIAGGTSSNDGDFKALNKGGVDMFIMKLGEDGKPRKSNDTTKVKK